MVNIDHSRHKVDVCILGGGISGLLIAHRLLSLGYKIILIDHNNKLASGASTRNQGWLHCGTYHCHSISNKNKAIEVARKCIYGYEYIKSYVPEAIENPNLSSYALISHEDSLDQSICLWDEIGIYHKSVSKDEIKSKIPLINEDGFSKCFKVKDVCINTRILYKKIMFDITRKGGLIFKNVQSKFTNKNKTVLFFDTNGNKNSVDASIYIYATGFYAKKLFIDYFNIKLPIRLWRSHLVKIPKISDYICFFLDTKEVTVMRHGNNSIIGFNNDAKLCDNIDLDWIDKEVEDAILSGIKRRFHINNIESHLISSCIKVDLPNKYDDDRSLETSMIEPMTNHICVFPGKMTNAPFLADEVAKLVFKRLDDDCISYRPWD